MVEKEDKKTIMLWDKKEEKKSNIVFNKSLTNCEQNYSTKPLLKFIQFTRKYLKIQRNNRFRGMKKTYFSGVHKCLEPLLKNGLEKGVFSGAAVGVYSNLESREEKVILCHGKTTKKEKGRDIQKTTFFDLASLTKPLCTVLSCLHLIYAKKIQLESKILELVEVTNKEPLEGIQIKHLLSHSSGLKAYIPFYKNFDPVQRKENKKRLVDLICSEKAENKPGVKSVYSDLGYILLGEVIENISGSRLDTFFTTKITKPLGLENELLFLPIESLSERNNENTAATQLCRWRKRMLQGEVDDEHSWLMNGVAGHAGLFGTIKGVMNICIHILNQWKEREVHPAYTNSLLQQALKRQHFNQTWCMGFDTPSARGSSSGSLFSANSVGHLGFTGTSFWIDLEKEIVITLLTNRVHPDRSNEKIKKFRPLLHDTVMKTLLN